MRSPVQSQDLALERKQKRAGDEDGERRQAVALRTAPMLAATTSPTASASVRGQGLVENQVARDGGDGRVEAHQHGKGGGRHPAQGKEF
jgi:hypothetical protein